MILCVRRHLRVFSELLGSLRAIYSVRSAQSDLRSKITDGIQQAVPTHALNIHTVFVPGLHSTTISLTKRVKEFFLGSRCCCKQRADRQTGTWDKKPEDKEGKRHPATF